MKIVFFGTPCFAAQILEEMIDHGSEIVAVVTKPDKAQGRSKRLLPPPVKKIASERLSGIPIFQPEKISTPEYYEKLAEFKADLFVIVAYGELIKQPLLEMPALGCINVHGSLLPAYRGAAPIQHALLDGVSETGVSIMYLVRKMDAGPVIETAKIHVCDQVTGGELFLKLCTLGSQALLPVLDRFELEGKLPSVSQNEEFVTFAPKITLDMLEMDWKRPAQELHNQVRAFAPKPCAWVWGSYKGEKKKLKIGQTSLVDEQEGDPGEFKISEERLFVFCGKGALELHQIQLEGKRMMKVSDFLRGTDLDALRFY